LAAPPRGETRREITGGEELAERSLRGSALIAPARFIAAPTW
jgi:hypothetical protein